MTGSSSDRAPAVFDLDDPRLEIEPPPEEDVPPAPPPFPAGRPKSGLNWVRLFLGALGGLLLLALIVWMKDTALALLARGDWLGWAAEGLFALAGLAFVMIVAREIGGILRLSAITAVRRRAEAALGQDDAPKARAAVSEIVLLFKDRPELTGARATLVRHRRDILDARQVLTIAERELILPLDRLARTATGTSGRRVSVATSLSPAAIFAVGFVAYENLRMLRTLAAIYGGRPGVFAMLKLMRLIAGHLAVTGSIAFTDDILQQFIGHGLTARLSRRLGEGLVNGGFTIRVGLAAIEVLRPLPYLEARPPRLREFVAEFLRFGQTKDS